MIGEVIYLFIATLALMLRRLENWVSGLCSRTTVTQIKPGELEARDAEYYKRLESRKESERNEAKRTTSIHSTDGLSDATVNTRKSQTIAELLNRKKKHSRPLHSEVHSKGVLKLMQKSNGNDTDIAKQKLPNPARLEQDLSTPTHKDTSDMFVKYRNKKVQLSPPPKKSVENTSDTAKVAVNLPPLKEKLQGKKVTKNNSNPKHKRKLTDMLRNLPRKVKPHKSNGDCNVDNLLHIKEDSVNKKNNMMQNNSKKSNNNIFLKNSSSWKRSLSIRKLSSPILKRRSNKVNTETSAQEQNLNARTKKSAAHETEQSSSGSTELSTLSTISTNCELVSQHTKAKNANEDFTDPEVILRYRLATDANNKKKQKDSILHETTYENYKRDLTASPCFKPLIRPESAGSPVKTESLLESLKPEDSIVEKLKSNRLYDDEDIILIESIEKEFL